MLRRGYLHLPTFVMFNSNWKSSGFKMASWSHGDCWKYSVTMEQTEGALTVVEERLDFERGALSLRYAGVNQLFLIIGHLYLIGVWLGEDKKQTL
jgi:hypothetical protein